MLSFTVSDATGQTWVTTFNDEAEKLLKIPASELLNLKVFPPLIFKENDFNAYEAKFESILFNQYVMKCRAKQEVYQDEAKLRVSCVSLDKVAYVERSRQLLGLISQMA